MAVRLFSATKRRTPLRCGVWPGDVWRLGAHRFIVGDAPGDLEVAEVVLRAYGLYTGQHAELVARGGMDADHGAAGQLAIGAYEAGYESVASLFESCAGTQARARDAWGRRARASVAAFSLPAVHATRMVAMRQQAGHPAGHPAPGPARRVRREAANAQAPEV